MECWWVLVYMWYKTSYNGGKVGCHDVDNEHTKCEENATNNSGFQKIIGSHSNVKGELGTVALVCDQNCSNFVG